MSIINIVAVYQIASAMKKYIEEDRKLIHKLIAYMHEHCTEPFDVKKHAGMVFFSESKLNKVFKQYTGVGPGTYVRRLKMMKARELYESGIGNWTEVSLIVGYSDLPSFSKAYKKITGFAPTSCHAV